MATDGQLLLVRAAGKLEVAQTAIGSAIADKDLFAISQQPMLDIPLDELEGEAIDDIGDCFCNAA